ncbi:MAG: hypothetical protein JW816_03285 [Candidatus Buchananbacteria bacterium]|nr:hypothetical protein [Candidatus Buchananbacteria bacterium]
MKTLKPNYLAIVLGILSIVTTAMAASDLVVLEVKNDQVTSTQTIRSVEVTHSDGLFGYSIELNNGRVIKMGSVVTPTEPKDYQIKYVAFYQPYPDSPTYCAVLAQCGGEVWSYTHRTNRNNGQPIHSYHASGKLGTPKMLAGDMVYWPIGTEAGISYSRGSEIMRYGEGDLAAAINLKE